MRAMEILWGDITAIQVDAIVKATNNAARWRGSGWCDSPRRRVELLAECRKLGGCGAGQAKITPDYHISSDCVETDTHFE